MSKPHISISADFEKGDLLAKSQNLDKLTENKSPNNRKDFSFEDDIEKKTPIKEERSTEKKMPIIDSVNFDLRESKIVNSTQMNDFYKNSIVGKILLPE